MAVTVALTVAASVPTRSQRSLGVVTAATGVLAIVITIEALLTHSTLNRVLHYSVAGVYLAILGYAACAAGALAASRHGSKRQP
jgi:hypothetical protein